MRSEQEIRQTIELLKAYVRRDAEKIIAAFDLNEYAHIKESIRANKSAISYLEWVLGGDSHG